MSMKRTILAAAALLLLAACGGNAQRKTAAATATADMQTAQTAPDYAGTYKGTLPAADCPGIEMTLTLRPDGTYSEHSKYIDRDVEFDEQGRYAVSDSLLTLTSDQGGTEGCFRIEENRLRWLDADKQVIKGPLAENYILTKTTE